MTQNQDAADRNLMAHPTARRSSCPGREPTLGTPHQRDGADPEQAWQHGTASSSPNPASRRTNASPLGSTR